jgi:hypothetical protein
LLINRNKPYLIQSLLLVALFLFSLVNGLIYLEIAQFMNYILFEILVFISFWLLCRKLLLEDYKNKFFALIVGWYIIFGYYFKPIIMFEYYKSIFSLETFTFNQYVNSYLEILPSTSFQSILIFMLLYIVSKSTKNIKFNFNRLVYINLKKLLIVVILSLILKVIVHYYLGMGIPGVEPSTKIPIIGGLITFYSRFSLFAILNFYLLYAIIMNKKIHLISSFIAIIIFILIDMSIASKYSMFYQIFLFIIIYFITNNKYKLPKSYLVILVIFTFILFFTYKYINYYRYALIKGYDVVEAIGIALNSKVASSESFLLSIFDRITGIEKVIFIEQFTNKIKFITINNFFDDSFTVIFTNIITGIENKNNAVGATQIGFMYLFSSISWENNLFVIFLYALMYFTFGLFLLIIKNRIYIQEDYYLITSLLGIFGIYVLFGSGNAIFFFKELIVLFFSILFIFKIADKKYV